MAFKPTRIGPEGIVARVVAPAEEKFSGQFSEIRLAVGHGYRDKQTDEWKDTTTTFLTYSASGEWAKPLHEADKGDLVEITGNWSIETEPYGEGRTSIKARYGNFEVIDKYVPKSSGGGF